MGATMKKLWIACLAIAAGVFTTPARADVDVRIGIGVPGVVIGTNRHDHYRSPVHPPSHYYPPVRQRHYHPPIRHPHYQAPLRNSRRMTPPAYFYPEHVYRGGHKHYQSKHRHHHFHHARPPEHKHLRHGRQPLRPPHAYSRGYWTR